MQGSSCMKPAINQAAHDRSLSGDDARRQLGAKLIFRYADPACLGTARGPADRAEAVRERRCADSSAPARQCWMLAHRIPLCGTLRAPAMSGAVHTATTTKIEFMLLIKPGCSPRPRTRSRRRRDGEHKDPQRRPSCAPCERGRGAGLALRRGCCRERHSRVGTRKCAIGGVRRCGRCTDRRRAIGGCRRRSRTCKRQRRCMSRSGFTTL